MTTRSDHDQQPDQRPDRDLTDDLAATLGVEAGHLAGLIGAGWRVNPSEPWTDYDADPTGGLDPDDLVPHDVTPWHITGEPPQLMVRVFPHGVFLARPEGVWAHGSHGLEHHPLELQYVASSELAERAPEIVRSLLEARRHTFRWCRYCRHQRAPENLLEPDACHGCGTSWFGVVY